MQYNTSSAYDLSVYEQSGHKPKPSLRVVEQRKSAKRTLAVAFTPTVLGGFFIVITLLGLMVYNNVQLNEISGSINAVQREITRMESEYVVMRSQMEAMASLEVVAQKAGEELGMHRLDKYQTRYVNLYGEDKIILAERPQQSPPSQSASLTARGVIGRLMEYIP